MTKMNVKDKLQDDTLDLSLCDLEEVPVREIAVLKRARNLDLSNNALVSLPKTFVTLTQIIKLDLSKNMLTEIPENFGEMVHLRHLDLYSNKISRLPLSLGNLKNLKWLDLKENPLAPAVASVAGPCSNASECQACAKKVVTYLANVQLTVEEEKQRRITAETEKAVATKKEGKKKKKTAEKAKTKGNTETDVVSEQKEETEQNDTIVSKPSESTENQKSDKKKDGMSSLLCKAIVFLLIWAVFFSLMIILAVAIFPIYDERRSDAAFRYLETEVGLPVRHYRQVGKNMFEKFVTDTIVWTNYTRTLVEGYYNQYFMQDAAQTKNVT
ncbi:leucine-rich repeat-containing protein 59-like [Belonocnema kinseyi]|uniref:leucine-rich repeat-containing protein 59-like n=1 Tax=Belonocnema kinseyi TaxID=2817044 RepID=UPI00143D40F4|nr:leucine-rich repeat-containing protein 59-like [Belonocnema kinseyi]XP_033221427.1 leucine-rich repeat-containing protein 59-like [Belonocnema kinseyi]